jgi:hypothetical protein
MNSPAFLTGAFSSRTSLRSDVRAVSSRRGLPRFASASLAAALVFSSFVDLQIATGEASGNSGSCAAPTMATSLNDLTGLRAVDGTAIPKGAFDGKVVIAVNVASACGMYRGSPPVFAPTAGDTFDAALYVARFSSGRSGMHWGLTVSMLMSQFLSISRQATQIPDTP